MTWKEKLQGNYKVPECREANLQPIMCDAFTLTITPRKFLSETSKFLSPACAYV